ncbi:MAG: hypothetical protein QXF79_06280 [Ignisphaera sp.]
MAEVINEVFYLQSRSTPLHSYKAIYLKILLIVIAISSRFIHLYAILITLAINGVH